MATPEGSRERDPAVKPHFCEVDLTALLEGRKERALLSGEERKKIVCVRANRCEWKGERETGLWDHVHLTKTEREREWGFEIHLYRLHDQILREIKMK